VLPVQPDFVPGEIGIDTIWFDSWEPAEYYFPVYYETAVIDTIWTGISRLSEMNILEVHPNPAVNFIQINIPESQQFFEYEIIDFKGALQEKSGKLVENGAAVVDVSGLKNGLYFIRILTHNGAYISKFVIHK
jgi:hypothetical protein